MITNTNVFTLKPQKTTFNILIVDDEECFRRWLQVVLECEGYTIYTASSGEEAIEQVRSSPPDLILLDVILPKSNGFEICRFLRKEECWATIPIVILTSLNNSEEKMKALDSGAQDFLTKPIDQIELCTRITNLLKLKSLYDDLDRSNKELKQQIAEYRKIQTQLRLSEARKAAILDASIDCIISTDYMGKIIEVNNAVETTFGYTAEEIIGMPMLALIIHPPIGALGKLIEIRARRKDGSDFPAEMTISPIYLNEYTPIYTAYIRDISERKRAEAEVRKSQEQEKEIGWKIQQTLLFGTPPANLKYVQIAAMTLPSNHVDGDFYDFFYHHNACFDVLVGDVMGKGISEALLGAAVKSHFLSALHRLIMSAEKTRLPSPEEVVRFVHQKITKELIALNTFITLCYARFDFEKQQADLVDCGHTRTIYFDSTNNVCRTLSTENVPLGFIENENYHQISIPFNKGDLFFFYSDGVIEAKNPNLDLFGEEYLVHFIKKHHECDVEMLINKIREEVLKFVNRGVFTDDLTCVAVKILDGKKISITWLDNTGEK